MKKDEYIAKIKECFENCFQDEIMCTEYEWGNNLPWGIDKPLFNERERKFAKYIKVGLGLSFSNNYHAYGIGNNNEYTIVLRETDKDGFVIEKQICKYEYVYGIYCHLVSARLETLDGEIIVKRGRI